MHRTILTPPAIAAPALAELKQWLGISTAHDDAALTALLRASLDICEAFTGIMPLVAECEETAPPARCWRGLATRPVQAITGVEAIAPDGQRFALASGDYEIDLDADGGGRVRLPALSGRELSGRERVAVRFTAGLVAEWEDLPAALRHGIARLAAHQHRERETGGASPLPPASVAALWRPWRRLRVA